MPFQKSNKIHFPGLNGLRFLAAFAVMVHHIEQIKFFQGLPNNWNVGFFAGLGDQGVDFFFTLSGFLITFLLYQEQEDRGINLKKFYLRRMLRIWPLYYFITFLAFFVLPHFTFLNVNGVSGHLYEHFSRSLMAYILFSAHIAERFFGPVVFASALWSTSVEEHFYLVWPILIKTLKGRFPQFLVALTAIWVSVRFFSQHSSLAPQSTVFGAISDYLHMFRIDCMAVGGLGAWIYLHRRKHLNMVFSIYAQLAIYATLLYRLIFDLRFSPIANEINCLVFLLIIFNISLNTKSIFKLENPVLNYLGKISFGLYAFNWLGITIWINTEIHFGFASGNRPLLDSVTYSGAIAVVVLLATFSYYCIERPFLKLKKRFTNLASPREVKRIEPNAAPASYP